MAAARLSLGDIQGNVVRGFGAKLATYLFVRIDDAGNGRKLIEDLCEHALPAEGLGEKPASMVNVGLSFEGLRALDVPEPLLATFPKAFQEGMAARAEFLGDAGPSAPGRWEDGLRRGQSHLLIALSAKRRDRLDARRKELVEAVRRRAGLELAYEQPAAALPFEGRKYGGREHFGFADGMAQPAIEGSGVKAIRGQGIPKGNSGWREVSAGEFVLGYEDEEGVLPEAPAAPLGRNGTYMVWRKLHQDVARFRALLSEAAGGSPEREELLAAKTVGRWRDGTPLVLSPDRADPAIADKSERLNDFRYEKDGAGSACPLGAHIRRTNPRDALGWGGRLTRRHRIIRRGMPYGEPLPEGAKDDGKDRGLVFACFCADLARQFEVVQGQWCADGDTFGLGSESDFLLGADGRPGKMTVQGSPPVFLRRDRSLVTMKGGEYLFLPGLAALRALAAGIE